MALEETLAADLAKDKEEIRVLKVDYDLKK
jgi:hypothetical protein